MEIPPPPTFADLLKRSRRDAGVTQEELAERAGLSARAISDLERGINRMPYRTTVERLVDALGLPARERSRFELVARGRAAPPSGVSRINPDSLLVGRESELKELKQQLQGGEQPVLMLVGEPGIGKTRLLQEAAQWGASLGYTVLEGGCQRRSGEEPYSPVLDALARYIDRQSDDTLSASLEGCSWLVRLLPELAETVEAPSGPLAVEHERRLMFAAVARFLGNIAGRMGTLLVLDDLQWAGGDVFELLTSFVSPGSGVPVRVVGGYRQTEVDLRHPLFVALADLSRAHLVRQLQLGPLPDESAVELLGVILGTEEGSSSDVEQEIVRRTGGVPFFLVSYGQTLRTSDMATDGDLPWDITQNVMQRVGALTDPALEILSVAAVIGRVVPHRLLQEAGGWLPEQVWQALDAAARAGLLVEDGPLDHRFIHDVIREVIEADLGAGRRAVLHRRVGLALEALSGPTVDDRAAELAWHFLEGNERERALHYMMAAGDQAEAVLAHDEAERQFQAAMHVAQEVGNRSREAEAWEKTGRVLTRSGRYEAALQALGKALELYGLTGDTNGETRAAAEIGATHAKQGTPRQGLDRIVPLIERLQGRGASTELADLYLRWARLEWDSGSPSEALTVAERALEIGQVLDNHNILIRAKYWRGLALWQLGRRDDEAGIWQELSERSGATDAGENSAEVAPTVPLLVRVSRGEVRESKPLLLQKLERSRVAGDPAEIAWDLSLLGFCAFVMADWSFARACMQEALTIKQSLGSSFIIAPLMDMGLLTLCEGDWETAARYLQQAAEEAKRKGDLFVTRIVAERLARLDILQGRPERAVDRLLPLLDRPGVEESRVALLLSTLGWAYLALGDVNRAESLADDAVSREVAQENRLDLAYALVIQAKVLTHRRWWNEAEQCLQRALVLNRSAPFPYAEAQTLHDYGLLKLQRGEREMGRQQLQEAYAIFARLGAQKDLERTARALEGLDSRAG
jgi:tetratricopeptide (TPR) repeat protein/transcriptional regulator with XRE-family HTH domain